MPYLGRLKQAADLHSNRLSQWLVLEQLNHPARMQRLQALATTYRRKRDAFDQALDRHMRQVARWQVPPGGLFFWLTLNHRIDTRQLLPVAIEQGVAFMPGESFHPNPEEGLGTMRLNFSHASEASIEKGLAVLAQLVDRSGRRYT